MKLELTEEKTKELLKEVIVELLQTKKEVFSEIFAEALEEICLAEAIKMGRNDDFVSEEEIFLLLDKENNESQI